MKKTALKTGKSIEQLENDFRNDDDLPTPLVEKVHRYRNRQKAIGGRGDGVLRQVQDGHCANL